MTNIEQRMNRLEKQVRNYRIGGLVVVVGIAVTLLMSSKDNPPVPEVLKAKSFQVVNASGDVLAEMSTDKGNGLITTYTPSGRKLFQVFTSDGGGGGINTFDTDGQVNFKVTRTTDGGGYLALFNSDRQEIFEVGTTTANSGYFRMNDRYGEKLAWLTFTEGGGGYFSLYGKNNKEYMKFSTPDVGGRIGVYNSNNNRIAFMGTQDTREGNMSTYSSTGAWTGGIPK